MGTDRKGTGRKSTLVNSMLFFLIASLLSLFFIQLRVKVSSGNIIPLSMISMLPCLFCLPLTARLQGQRLRLPLPLLLFLLIFVFFVLSDLLHGGLLAKKYQYLKIFSLWLWAFLICNLIDRFNAKFVIRLFVILGIACLFIGFYRLFVVQDHYYFNLFYGDIRSRNASAYTLIVFMVFLLGFIVTKAECLLWRRAVDRAAFVLFLFALIMTYSRGAFIALVFPLIAVLILKNRNPIKSVAILILFLLIVFSALFVAERYFGGVYDRFSSVLSTEAKSQGGKKISNAGRIGLAKAGIRIVVSSPLLGFGIHSFHDKVITGRYSDGERLSAHSSHNQFLDMAIQGGLGALLCFLGVIFYFRRSIVAFFLFSNRKSSALTNIIGAGWAVHFLYFFFSWPLERVIFWTFLGIVLKINAMILSNSAEI